MISDLIAATLSLFYSGPLETVLCTSDGFLNPHLAMHPSCWKPSCVLPYLVESRLKPLTQSPRCAQPHSYPLSPKLYLIHPHHLLSIPGSTVLLLTWLITGQVNKSWRWGVEARDMAFFQKSTDQEDSRLTSQNNYLIGVWMPGSFLEQRERGWGTKVKRQKE